MMNPCSKCFENIWKFEMLPDNWIRAYCQMCPHEIEWEKKNKTRKVKKKIQTPQSKAIILRGVKQYLAMQPLPEKAKGYKSFLGNH